MLIECTDQAVNDVKRTSPFISDDYGCQQKRHYARHQITGSFKDESMKLYEKKSLKNNCFGLL